MFPELTVNIFRRINAVGNPFTEILYKWNGGNALTRLWFVIPNTPHQVEIEKQAFITRMKSNGYVSA